jgi:two-component system NtrC family sensor kinase
MKVKYLHNLSLQKKFIIVTYAAVIILMVLIGVMITRRESAIMYRDIERQGKILAETLAIPVMNDLIYERLGLVEEGGLIDNYVTEIFGKKDIDLIYMAVLDGSGKIISHNDFNEYGKVYDDPITANALSSNVTVVQKFYNNKTGHVALDFATPLSIGKKRWGTLKFAVSLERLDNELKATVLSVVAVTFVLLIGGLGIILLLSRRFIRPITELARTMEQAGGDMLDVKVSLKGGDEIALLGTSFNEMIDRIRRSNLKLKNTHNELIQFISAIERTGGDLFDMKVDISGCDEITLLCESFNEMIGRIEESNRKLKQTHEKLLQSQKLASIGILASGVAHEINSPLGGMFNCVQMLEQMGDNIMLRQKYLKLIKDGLGRIENTVGKLLWRSRKNDKNPELVAIRRSLEDAYAFIGYKIKDNNITYRENVEDNVSLFIDYQDLQQIIINLLDNAVQSMKNGGTLTVSALRNGSNVIIEVSDSGEGIGEESIDKIFDPFYTTKNPGEGTGLGLWLTYDIVSNYKGEISVKSKKGEGTTFSIKFDAEEFYETQGTDHRG